MLLACTLVGCGEASKQAAPRWLVARQSVAATDDPTVILRRGFGVQIVEQRGDAGRSSEGRWFPLHSFEAVAVAPAQPTQPDSHVELPTGLVGDERWIDVDIARQRVTAYVGARPVRAMKASTGVGEEGAMYSTPRGVHRIYAKLRSTTMRSEDGDPHPYRFEAVPHVQYFDREVALHGAYWHRRFGERVSHGCVNLAPADAAWLFEFSAPQLGATERERSVTGKLGTLVRVR